MLLHMHRGTPYIYQGEEIGMTNGYFTDITQYRDVESLHYFEILKEQGREEEEIYRILRERSRDNSRTPMQWDGEGQAGFTSGTPWIGVNKNYEEINVRESLADPDSVFFYYQKLIKLRKSFRVIREGNLEDWEILLSNYADPKIHGKKLVLDPFGTVMLYCCEKA